MKNEDTGIYSYKMTVQSSTYNYARGGWDYTVKAMNGMVYTGVAEKELKKA